MPCPIRNIKCEHLALSWKKCGVTATTRQWHWVQVSPLLQREMGWITLCRANQQRIQRSTRRIVTKLRKNKLQKLHIDTFSQRLFSDTELANLRQNGMLLPWDSGGWWHTSYLKNIETQNDFHSWKLNSKAWNNQNKTLIYLLQEMSAFIRENGRFFDRVIRRIVNGFWTNHEVIVNAHRKSHFARTHSHFST